MNAATEGGPVSRPWKLIATNAHDAADKVGYIVRATDWLGAAKALDLPVGHYELLDVERGETVAYIHNGILP